MITAEKLSFGFSQKELYNKISFTIEEKDHCVLIGSNGTGKSTLLDMICHPKEYLYDGKLILEEGLTIGHVEQFYDRTANDSQTVFDYISEIFVKLQEKINTLCDAMAEAEDMDVAFLAYQEAYDQFTALDGDFYESNIKKQLKLAGLLQYENLPLSKLSGGEFKLVQVIKEMMALPKVLMMDEPDVFLDFEHLTALVELINHHKGTIIVITHNRYLLNHCFNKILHLENKELQSFDGTYVEYNFLMLQNKIELQEMAASDEEEIARNEKIVDKMRKNATRLSISSLGRALHARVSLLERLEARKTKDPFIDIFQPKIQFELAMGEDEMPDGEVLLLKDYELAFQNVLLSQVDLVLNAGEKVAIVGKNGTGKTTLLRDVFRKNSEAITIAEGIKTAYLSQIQGEMLDESKQIMDLFWGSVFEKPAEVVEYLKGYGFEEDGLYRRVSALSGGEKNLLQVARLAAEPADLLLLDEPTSHLDMYAQIALEEAIAAYKGTVLMVSHDFYTIVNCADYILFVEDQNLRRMSIRKFRKMIYENHFSKDYLELEQKKKEMEKRVTIALKNHHFEQARELAEELAEIIQKMK